ncbi:MAG TPA: tetratricopeptide repeat protein [Terracidiphilus sp.]|nr:tetratricopeptide repeat protein [Terracidiphilus sp.]
MKRLVMMLAVMSLLFGVVAYAKTNPAAPAAKKDKMEAARLAEEKGDLDRLHKDYQSALSHYDSAVRINTKSPDLYNKMGIAELQLKDYGPARKYFVRAIKLNPQFFAPLNNLGVLELLDRRYKSSISYFKQALALDETNAHTHLNLAEAWMGLGNVDYAMTEYARALELDADVLSSTPEGIAAQYTTPEQRARVSFLIAKMYMKRGNLDGALEYLRKAKDGHYSDMASVYKDPVFTPLWNDPRLAKIVKP